MSSDLPDPPVPADVDLRDMDGFMLNGERLINSELWALSSGDEFKRAVGLWCRAWKQLPAGSLPNDDKILAAFSGAGRNWPKVRAMALRGFVLCSDGRLYHTVLCEDVLRAWERKLAYRADREADRARLKRWRDAKRRKQETASETLGETVSETPFETRFNGVAETRTKRLRQEQQQKQGQNKEEDQIGVGESESPSVAIIRAFDEERVRAFGQELARPWPAPTDGVMAQRWVDAGATVDLCRAVFASVQQRRKAASSKPIDNLKYFENAIAQAMADKVAPMPSASPTPRPKHGPSPPAVNVDAEVARDRMRVKVFLDRGTWLPSWGATPLQTPNGIAPAVLEEFREQLDAKRAEGR